MIIMREIDSKSSAILGWRPKVFWHENIFNFFHDNRKKTHHPRKDVMDTTISVQKVTILTGEGPDILYLHLNLPNGCFPYTGNASAKLEVAYGSGMEYIKNHLPDATFEHIKRKPLSQD